MDALEVEDAPAEGLALAGVAERGLERRCVQPGAIAAMSQRATSIAASAARIPVPGGASMVPAASSSCISPIGKNAAAAFR